MAVEAEKGQDLLSASWQLRKAGSRVPEQTQTPKKPGVGWGGGNGVSVRARRPENHGG